MTDSFSLFESEGPRIYTVSDLTEEIKTILEDHFEFIWMEGEISNFRAPASGHYYMVLKDQKAQIRAVMFRPQVRYLKFVPEDGTRVIVQGRLGLYPPRGEYQIILDYLEPLGVGALALAFEQLKRKLAAEGLFDEEAKRPLPFLPQRVAVVTSPTGAAIRDFLKVIRRRFANIDITLVPVRVQGDEAAGEIVGAIELVNETLGADVIVLTRGGGSLEDLQAFNREEVARAIRASRIPVLCAVGHEIDVTIADLASDLRAPTPSAAAEILVVEKESLRARVTELGWRLEGSLRTTLSGLRERLRLVSRGLRDPRKRLADSWMRLDEMSGRLLRATGRVIRDRRGRLASEHRALILKSPLETCRVLDQRITFMARALRSGITKGLRGQRAALSLREEKIRGLSPLAVLKRGYSITLKVPEKRILKDVSGVKERDRVRVILGEGELSCIVEDVNPGRVVPGGPGK